MTAVRVTRPLAALCAAAALWGAPVVGPATAQDKWVLWGRTVDLKGEKHGEWLRGQVFDAERWCKGAMTNAINQALSKQASSKAGQPKAGLTEYQCLPDNVTPPLVKGK